MFFGGGGFDPEDFMGGRMPGGMGGRGQQKPVDTTEYYKLLGVDKNASTAEIKKAYRKMCLKHHPDRGGDQETLAKINNAYETLADDNKRQLYDKGGKEAVEQGGGGGGGGGGNDIFSQFFGGGGGGGGRGGPRKGEDMVTQLKVTLEDCYNGRVRKLAVTRDEICTKCDGRGGKPGAETECDTCDGHGVVIIRRQLGPGMIQQMQKACHACGGKGKVIDPSLRCKTCKGKKVTSERKILEVAIDKGARSNQKIRFRGESSQKPGTEPGDIVFVLKPKEHAIFKRKGHHLIMKKTISLTDALCGCTFTVEHLDGRVLAISTAPGQVVKPDATMMIEHEGMPMLGNPFVKGHLVVMFTIDFPSTVSPEQRAALEKLLPRTTPTPTVTDAMEPSTLQHVDMDTLQQEYEQNKSAYDSDGDDEEGGGEGGRRVQCAQG